MSFIELMKFNFSIAAAFTLFFAVAGTTASFAAASEVGKSAIYEEEPWIKSDYCDTGLDEETGIEEMSSPQTSPTLSSRLMDVILTASL